MRHIKLALAGLQSHRTWLKPHYTILIREHFQMQLIMKISWKIRRFELVLKGGLRNVGFFRVFSFLLLFTRPSFRITWFVPSSLENRCSAKCLFFSKLRRMTFICPAKHELAIFSMCDCRYCSPTSKRRSGVRRRCGQCGKNNEANVLDKDNPEWLWRVRLVFALKQKIMLVMLANIENWSQHTLKLKLIIPTTTLW